MIVNVDRIALRIVIRQNMVVAHIAQTTIPMIARVPVESHTPRWIGAACIAGVAVDQMLISMHIPSLVVFIAASGIAIVLMMSIWLITSRRRIGFIGIFIVGCIAAQHVRFNERDDVDIGPLEGVEVRILTMRKSPCRSFELENRLRAMGVPFTLAYGVDGDATNPPPGTTPKMYGNYLGHLSTITSSNATWILVFEDDAVIPAGFRASVHRIIAEFKEYDLVVLDSRNMAHQLIGSYGGGANAVLYRTIDRIVAATSNIESFKGSVQWDEVLKWRCSTLRCGFRPIVREAGYVSTTGKRAWSG
jgi:hypothetical protein